MKRIIVIVLESDSQEVLETKTSDIYEFLTGIIEKENPTEEYFSGGNQNGFAIKNYFKRYNLHLKIV